jgi:GNAT superfamily N-acetyltransferase
MKATDRTMDDNNTGPRTHFSYPIRTCEPKDEAAILALLRETVGETAASQKTTTFWKWKHASNPFGASYSVCATDPVTCELVGLRTLMWWQLRPTGGQALDAVRPVDTATHPGHQRRGIFSALTRYAIDDLETRGIPFIFNTPNANSLPGYLKLGWSVVARFPIYLRPVRLGRIVRAAVRPSRSDTEGANDSSRLISWAEFRQNHDADLKTLIERNERTRRHVGYRTVRDLPYLDWRYGEHPDIEYSVHPSNGEEGLDGLIIGRDVTGARGMRTFVITEMLLRDPGRAAGARLLRGLIRARHHDYLMAHFAEGTVERQALFRAGFVRAPRRGYTVVARALNLAPADPTHAGSWDLTLGELEIF